MKTLTKRVRVERKFLDMLDILDKIKEEGKVLKNYFYEVEYPGKDIILTLEFTEEK